MREPAPLIVFSDDWGRHPSSCQHLVQQLSTRRQVTWINTIGLRPPRFDRATVTRGYEKVSSWITRSAQSGNGSSLQVLNPIMWPSFRTRFTRSLNRRLLGRAARHATRDRSRAGHRDDTPPAARPGRSSRCREVGVLLRRRLFRLAGPRRTQAARSGTRLGQESRCSGRGEWRSSIPPREFGYTVASADSRRRSRLLAEVPASCRDMPALAGPLVVYWGVVDRRLTSR